MVLPLLHVAAAVVVSSAPAGRGGAACPAVYLPVASRVALGGSNIAHLPNRTVAACLEACCANPQCVGIDHRGEQGQQSEQAEGLDCWLHHMLVAEPIPHGQSRTSAVLCRAAAANCTLPPPFEPAPPPGPPPPLEITLSSVAPLGLRFDGIGGLAAVGGARLLYEYPEPTRGKILDLLFSASGGGAFYQILKVEIEGDSDSSYGSGPSFQHTADPASVSFNRGIYLPWLIKEAKQRQPGIKLYALSWGLPHWVGNTNGSTDGVLSTQGVKYHTDYLAGAKREHGIEFDYVGIWNESPWKRSYVKELRAALNGQGMERTEIVVPDGGDKGCLDCKAFDNGGDVTTALAHDRELTGAVDIIGIHGHDVEGTAGAPGWQNVTTINPRGLHLWNSEQNLIDGPLPQWEPTEQDAYGSGLGWPRIFITNYIRTGATATILCPITHSFTWNYGRQNHGHSQFVEPWSGHFGLGSAFWSQAHFTQFTRPGWHFLGGAGTGERCDPEDKMSCDTVWAALTDRIQSTTPAAASGSESAGSQGNLTLVVVHSANSSVSLELKLGGGDSDGSVLARWETVASHYFKQVESVTVGTNGMVKLILPARSVTTLTTLTAAGKHADVSWNPQRAKFPLPFRANFDKQPVGAPGRMLSDVFGAFEVAPAASYRDEYLSEGGEGGATKDAAASKSAGNVLLQGADTNPGTNSWSHFTHIRRSPFTSLPSGTNWQNYKFSVRAKLLKPSATDPELDAVVVCGRVPVWPPGLGSPAVKIQGGGNLTVPYGVCLTVQRRGQWLLTEAAAANEVSSVVVASGSASAALSTWQMVELQFSGYNVSASIGGVDLAGAAPAAITLGSGVAGFGSSWVNAVFDDVSLSGLSPAAAVSLTAGSFLYDCLAGQNTVSLNGWAGMVVEAKAAVMVVQLGRYKTRGNSQVHAMQIFRESDGAPMLPSTGASNATVVDMSCAGDLLGFCYTSRFQPVRLVAGERYYLVAEERNGSGSSSGESSRGDGEVLTEMADSARITTHAHRDGSTIMSYQGPGQLDVVGRVFRPVGSSGGDSLGGAGGWAVTPELDTSFGPVNCVLGS
jgi:hypothetical protein